MNKLLQGYNQIQVKSLSGLCALYNKKCPGGLNGSPGHLMCVVPWRTWPAFYSIAIRFGFSGKAFVC